MFILDSLFLSGFRWVLDTVATAADAERNDDTALREQLLAAEMRREMGEISDEEFAEFEADLLTRIREIKERREGGTGPIAFGAGAGEASADAGFSVEATVSGDFHEPAEPVAFEHHPVGVEDDHGTVIEGSLVGRRRRGAKAPRSTKAPRHAGEGRTPAPRRPTAAGGPARARRDDPVPPSMSPRDAAKPVRGAAAGPAGTRRPHRDARHARTKIRE
jgi:hypothetical protein